jgi:uncharacterized membrane protein YbaN (DUF454 family)
MEPSTAARPPVTPEPPAAEPAAAYTTAEVTAELRRRPLWQRALWVLAGVASLATGIVGIFVPLLPTTPFVLLAAFCFSRGSTRAERWLLTHPRFGPMVHDWRERRAVPLRAKQLATVMMTFGSITAAYKLPAAWAWLPAACCACVAIWLWRLPTRR